MSQSEQIIAQKVDQQAIEHTFRQMPSLWLGAMLVGALFVAGLWHSADHDTLLWWYLAYAASQGKRFYHTVRYFKTATRQKSSAYWGRILTLSALIQGVVWGAAALLFYNTESLSNQVFILCMILAMPISSIPITGYWLSSFYAFALSSSGMMALKMVTIADIEHLVMGFSLFVYILVVLVLGWGVGRSLREGIRLRFENQELIEELSLANQSKSRFLAAASHDLRQPVHSLALFSEALGPEVKSPRGKALLENMKLTLESHNSLLNSLLDISKLDAGVIEPQLERLPVRPLLENLYREVRPKAEEKGLPLFIRPCDHHVVSDATLLTNILRNLVGNAINYTASGWVLVACRRRGDRLLIQVWDSGCGIPASQQEAIFREFHQLNNPERDRGKGLGLGLAICRRVAAILGHKITLASRLGKGSVFSVSLPRVEAVPSGEENAARSSVIAPWQMKGRRVLVIDDEEAVRQGMAAVLEGWGCEVVLADGITEAVNAMATTPAIDAIISDYRLRHETTGLEAIAAVHTTLGRAIPAMLVTGDTDPVRLQEAKESGLILLHKPVNPAQMRSALGQLLAAAG